MVHTFEKVLSRIASAFLDKGSIMLLEIFFLVESLVFSHNVNIYLVLLGKTIVICILCFQVITEKGVSDLAQHFLMKHGITVIRRLRKTDNLRVARACGATIVNRYLKHFF
jgi:chaperonin GroEL (HSP60 family)